MSHELHLHKIGPINDCRLTLDSFTILTGPQANGKSTAAKAVYFFRSVKQDILSIMMQGGPNAVTGDKASTWSTVLKQRMKDKFLQLFGTSWVMPSDMRMEYQYSKDVSITVSLEDDFNDSSKNILGGADRITDGSDLIGCLIGQLHREIALAESDNSLLRLLEGTGNIPNGAQVQEYTNGNNQDGHNKENNLAAAHTCLCRVDVSIEVVLDFTNERIPVTYGLIQLRRSLCFD